MMQRINTKNSWTVCWFSLAAANGMAALSTWCYGRATVTTALAIASDPGGQGVAAATAERHLQTGGLFAVVGMTAAVVGCVAWGIAVRRREAGPAVLPVCLIAVYVVLALVMV